MTHRAPAGARDLARTIRAVILLAGRVGRNPLADGVARSLLDLPVDAERRVLDVWCERLAEMTRAYGIPHLRVLIAIDRKSPAPALRRGLEVDGLELEIVADAAEYRGTAGVVRDLTADMADADRVLVATAMQIQREPLREMLEALSGSGDGASIVPHQGSELGAAFLLQCSRLRDIPTVGFVDLKEQAIPAAEGRAPLHVTRRPVGSSFPLRTLAEYIHALRAIHAPLSSRNDGLVEDAYAESWEKRFQIVEPGAEVAADAVLHDAVVLDGGRVESGAVVARSVVCKGGVVKRGQRVVEAVVSE